MSKSDRAIDFAWYRYQVKAHGPLVATQLLCREVWSRTLVSFANKALPAKLAFPCCGWTGRRFHDYIEVVRTHRNAECPQCSSHPRHRALFLWISREHKLETRHGIGLVFSYEKALAPIWQSAKSLRLYRVDIKATRGADLLADMTRLPIANESIELLWCHHVLEHIKDDRAAMRDLYRILRPATGELIVSVPMEIGMVTREYGFADNKESGHWRLYGDDFVDRLSESGFSVEPVSPQLSPEEIERYGLIRERYYLCTRLPQTKS